MTMLGMKPDDERSTNLYINHLPEGFSEAALAEMLAPFGSLRRVKAGMRWGLAEFQEIASAEMAVQHLHGRTPEGSDQALVVEYNTYGRKRRRNDALYPHASVSHTNLYFNHLPLTYTSESFGSLLSRYGEVTRMKSGEGWGLAEFTTPQSAAACLADLNGSTIGSGQPLKVEYHLQGPALKGMFKAFKGAKGFKGGKKGDGGKGAAWGMWGPGGAGYPLPVAGAGCRNLYINNLPGGYLEENVRTLLQPYGSVVRVKVSETDSMRSWALAEMSAASEAVNVLSALNGMKLPASKAPLVVEYNNGKGRGSRGAFFPAVGHPMNPGYGKGNWDAGGYRPYPQSGGKKGQQTSL